eukprot:TRINITY_DN1453_c1_g1_i5.p2 TRINITY_DN1453_c1_g1~~TRINITY_DN1453_c1_g1_i5.p2  ORF type:complete len:241 (-),score=37.84 TRINITY_DN1453_c1_g1_i5:5-727(-)
MGQELLVIICSFLDPGSLLRARSVCKYFRTAANHDSLWEALCLKERPHLAKMYTASLEAQKITNWSQAYRYSHARHQWSTERTSVQISTLNNGRTMIVSSKLTQGERNQSIQTAEALWPGAAPFAYYEVAIEDMPTPWRVGFGFTTDDWKFYNVFVGFSETAWNYGYTSNGIIKQAGREFPHYKAKDVLGFWVEYTTNESFHLTVFLNGVKIHSGSETQPPPIYFTATVYAIDSRVSFVY